VKRAADIFETHGDEIRAMISLNVKEESAADDAFQNLFLTIVNTPVPEDVERVSSYLFRVVANDVIDESRRSSNYAEFVREYRGRAGHRAEHESPERDAISAEETSRMLRSLRKRLPSHEAEALIQKYYHDKEPKDAAKIMDVDSKSFSQYLYRGTTRMRRLHSEKLKELGDRNEHLQRSDKL
jgi:RNA polymerase sigma factor (sigma-70 family)